MGGLSLANQIEGQYDKLVSLYKDIYKASRYKAKIYVLGYPRFISSHSDASCDVNVGSLNEDERIMVTAGITYLNRVIKQAALSAGVMYVDIENSLLGHRLCDSGSKYVTGAVGWPVGINNDLQESFHPNHKGHMEMAFSVWGRTKGESLLSYDFCGDGSNNCPNPSATKDKIVRPSYFPQEKKNSLYIKMTNSTASKGGFLNVVLSTMLLKPYSLARVALHSDPVDLGEYIVSADGLLSFSVEVPSSIPAGYHTLIIDGETDSGESIEFEQIVMVLGPDPDDVDEDGIPDVQQVCGAFVLPSGLDEDVDGLDDACDPIIEFATDSREVDDDLLTVNSVVIRKEGGEASARRNFALGADFVVDFEKHKLPLEANSSNKKFEDNPESLTLQQDNTPLYYWMIRVALLVGAILLAVKLGMVMRITMLKG